MYNYALKKGNKNHKTQKKTYKNFIYNIFI